MCVCLLSFLPLLWLFLSVMISFAGGTLGNTSDNGSNDYETVLTSEQWQRLVSVAQRSHRGCPTVSLAVIPRNSECIHTCVCVCVCVCVRDSTHVYVTIHTCVWHFISTLIVNEMMTNFFLINRSCSQICPLTRLMQYLDYQIKMNKLFLLPQY